MIASALLSLVLASFASATVHNVEVGPGGNLTYSPENIAAVPGDQVVFHFNPKNHTVTQSTFADPCGIDPNGIDSDFHPVAANDTVGSTFTVNVTDTNPIWLHCKQTVPKSHCGAGMVFAINCGADGAPNSFSNFKKAALAFGAAQAASASAASAAPAATTPPTSLTTAAYGDYTIAAAPSGAVVTEAITLGTESWTTTYTSYPNSPNPTPAAAAGVVHVVQVGINGTFTFTPPTVPAQPRDIISFVFHAKNHSVTQSSFNDPCRKLNQPGVVAIDSGFMAVSSNATDAQLPVFNLTVNDTAPTWFYCAQQSPSSHCGAGMVFAINSDESPSSGRTVAAFQNVAKNLNGTSAAANAPPAATSATTTDANGAVSNRVGGVVVSFVTAIIIASFL